MPSNVHGLSEPGEVDMDFWGSYPVSYLRRAYGEPASLSRTASVASCMSENTIQTSPARSVEKASIDPSTRSSLRIDDGFLLQLVSLSTGGGAEEDGVVRLLQ